MHLFHMRGTYRFEGKLQVQQLWLYVPAISLEYNKVSNEFVIICAHVSQSIVDPALAGSNFVEA
jgi:hypothetical protein